tara:strand:- start:2805 stop:3236 length:432 start_codon:yes stop_codon:yes gene_type:complete
MATVVNSLGKLTGWNAITLRLLGRDVVGITKVQYNDEKTVEKHMGAGNYPVGKSSTNYTASASIDLYEEEVRELVKALPSGNRLQDIDDFDIVVSYALPTGGTQKDILHNCSFSTNGKEVNQGDGRIIRSFDLNPTHITENAA